MEMQYLVGRGFTSVTTGTKDENGTWKLVVTMGESLSYPNGTTREEHIEAMGMSDDYDQAHQTALKSCLQQLQDLVYGRGFDSLVEAMDYERSMEALGDSDVTSDETSATQQ